MNSIKYEEYQAWLENNYCLGCTETAKEIEKEKDTIEQINERIHEVALAKVEVKECENILKSCIKGNATISLQRYIATTMSDKDE